MNSSDLSHPQWLDGWPIIWEEEAWSLYELYTLSVTLYGPYLMIENQSNGVKLDLREWNVRFTGMSLVEVVHKGRVLDFSLSKRMRKCLDQTNQICAMGSPKLLRRFLPRASLPGFTRARRRATVIVSAVAGLAIGMSAFSLWGNGSAILLLIATAVAVITAIVLSPNVSFELSERRKSHLDANIRPLPVATLRRRQKRKAIDASPAPSLPRPKQDQDR